MPFATALLATTAQADTSGSDNCGSVCELLYDATDNLTMSRLVGGVLEPLLELTFIVVMAVLARAMLRRLVGSVIERMKNGDGAPSVLNRFADAVDGGHDAPAISLDRRARRADSLGALVLSVGSATIWTMALMMGLGALGMNLAPLIAGAGIIGVALGFGAQDLVKDFLSGVFMLAEDQYGVGDVIDVGEAAGVVEAVSLRTTRIRDVEGKLWHVPNGEITRVANASQAWARSLLDIDIAYGADIDEAIATIEAAGEKMAQDEKWADIFLEAPDVWGVQELGADSVKLRVVIKTVAGEQFSVSREFRRRLKYALEAEAIEIPFQQRTVWLRSDEAPTKEGVLQDVKDKAAAKLAAKTKSASTPAGSESASAAQEV
jgi:small-conductance mechanosensitive channel